VLAVTILWKPYRPYLLRCWARSFSISLILVHDPCSATTFVLRSRVWCMSSRFSAHGSNHGQNDGILSARLSPSFGGGLKSIFVLEPTSGSANLWYVNMSADLVLDGQLLGDQALASIGCVHWQYTGSRLGRSIAFFSVCAASVSQPSVRLLVQLLAAAAPPLGHVDALRRVCRSVYGRNWEDAGSFWLVPSDRTFSRNIFADGPYHRGLGRPDIGLRIC